MKRISSYTSVLGFEDYKVLKLHSSICFEHPYDFNIPYDFEKLSFDYLIIKDLPVEVHKYPTTWSYRVCFEPTICEDHKELLDTAKKVYVHQNCKLSRSLITEKYKKSVNPWLSDAVVIPKPEFGNLGIEKVAIFINEKDKAIVMVLVDSDALEKVKSFVVGEKFSTYMLGHPDTSYHKAYDTGVILNSEFMYVGDVLGVPTSLSYIADILTNAIPMDKTVYEESVQNTLGNDSNKLDFDSLTSIVDLLNSSDEDSVSTGLKALSVMDWMHYSQSVKFILNEVVIKANWLYNKACSSTSVKYMLKTISGARNRYGWPGEYDDNIYEDDFELFKRLKCHYHNVAPEEIMSRIRSFSFITVNNDGLLVPNIKSKD